MTPADLAILVGVILGPTGIWGIKELLGRRNAAIKVVDPAPLAPAVVTVAPDPQVAALQSQISALTNLLGDLAARVDVLEQERDQALRDVAHGAALLEQSERQRLVVTGYVVTLRNHIAGRKEPPPPDWPAGWIH